MPTDVSTPDRERLQALYNELHSLFLGDAQAAVETLERSLHEHRQLTRQIRQLLAIAEQAEDSLYALLDQARGGTLEAPLRGQRLARAATEILRVDRGHGEIHYRDWYDLLRDNGLRVGGRDPLATFLTSIARDPHIERVAGGRSGIYRIRVQA